jgi:hypothetical protein
MRPATIVTTESVDLTQIDRRFTRADLEFHGLGHAGVSYSARVYLNNPSADDTTPLDPDQGYAGSFHIFGHGGCFGEPGHCDVPQRRMYDPRGDHPLVPARKVVIATDAVRRAMDAGDNMTVTIVPLVTGETVQTTDDPDVVRFEKVHLITYQ